MQTDEAAYVSSGRGRQAGRRVLTAADRGLAGVVAADRWVRAGATLARYAAASVLSVVVYPVLAAVLYAALLVWASITDQPVGGPLGLPVLVLVGALVGLACTVLAAAVCGLVELVGLRPHLARPWLLLASWVLYGVLVVALANATVAPLDEPVAGSLPVVAVVLGVAAPAGLVVGLGVHTGGALTSLALRAARRRVARTSTDADPGSARSAPA